MRIIHLPESALSSARSWNTGEEATKGEEVTKVAYEMNFFVPIKVYGLCGGVEL